MPVNKDNKDRTYAYMALLYPDDPTHAKAIELIAKGYDHAMILHSKDEFTSEDEAKNPDNKAGTRKKPHYHCIIKFRHARWNTAVAKELGVDVRFLDPIRNFNNALLYLIHYNDDDKYKYKVEEVNGPLKKRLVEILSTVEKSDTDIVRELFNFIMDNDCYISNAMMLSVVLESGYLAVYRRNYHILNNLLKEHNFRFTENEAKESVTAFEYGFSGVAAVPDVDPVPDPDPVPDSDPVPDVDPVDSYPERNCMVCGSSVPLTAVSVYNVNYPNSCICRVCDTFKKDTEEWHTAFKLLSEI